MELVTECRVPGCRCGGDKPGVQVKRMELLAEQAICAGCIDDGPCTGEAVGYIGFRSEVYPPTYGNLAGRVMCNFGGDLGVLSAAYFYQEWDEQEGLQVVAEWAWGSANRWRRRVLAWTDGRDHPEWLQGDISLFQDWSREACLQAGRMLDAAYGPRRGRPPKSLTEGTVRLA